MNQNTVLSASKGANDWTYVDQVVNNGTRLPQSDSSVGVLDGWCPAIGVDTDEWLLLKDREVHVLRLIRNTQLFEDDGHLPWVWAQGVTVKLDWLRHIDCCDCEFLA